jgi:hypothetical protein
VNAVECAALRTIPSIAFCANPRLNNDGRVTAQGPSQGRVAALFVPTILRCGVKG